MAVHDETNHEPEKFDLDKYPEILLIHERRRLVDRRSSTGPSAHSGSRPRSGGDDLRLSRTERRRRIDPTTFEKQYTDDEIEFMNAMQCYKSQSGHPYPSYGEVLKVAAGLGYKKLEDHRSGTETA